MTTSAYTRNSTTYGDTTARASLGRYMAFYNARRLHASLDGKTPDQAHFNPLLSIPAAA